MVRLEKNFGGVSVDPWAVEAKAAGSGRLKVYGLPLVTGDVLVLMWINQGKE